MPAKPRDALPEVAGFFLVITVMGMAKTILELRTVTLRVLEQLSPDDPGYVANWIKSFDQQHGISPKARPKSKRDGSGGARRQASALKS